MDNSSYLELKQSLKDKYVKDFLNKIDKIGKDFGDAALDILGDEYEKLKTEYSSLEDLTAKTKKDFFSSADYVSVKNSVSDLKKQIECLDGDEKNIIDGELHKELSKLSTLNTTLNNRLKGTRERLDEIKKSISGIFDIHKDELSRLKTKSVKYVTDEINSVFYSYNKELLELKETFGITDLTKEYPFDFDKIEFGAVTDKFQAEYFSGIENNFDETCEREEIKPSKTSVVSENLYDYKN